MPLLTLHQPNPPSPATRHAPASARGRAGSPGSTPKARVEGLACFGGTPCFDRPVSTSNLVRPDVERFLAYSKRFHEARRYTNDGPLVKELETRLARFHGSRHCIATSNGFWALVLAMRCMARPAREEVVMPSLTYRRMADIVAWAGLVPRFCEVDADTLAISPATATEHVGDATALLLAVHPVVNCCDAPGLEVLARKAGVPLLFDAVESAYETVGGRKVGSFGDAECFSMHASKLINGFEGGYVTTSDDALAARLRCMRGFGFQGHDNTIEAGLNAKLNEVHAAMALASLDDLEDQVLRNRGRYRCYQRELARIPGLRLLRFDEREQTSFKNIVVELTPAWPLSRARTLEILNAEGALARAYYHPPLHARPASYRTFAEALPLTDELSNRFMLLPCGHHVTEDDVVTVCGLLAFVRRHAGAIRSRLA
ncbi:MAG: aminotransferase class I/II-fold pyridoxal phosphate-dependent enzyme [Rhodoferax sp.]|jgi:dTDP-4-amino-4,6-dideoxygalactose transaminase|nr:aminotransferase class I/II-fold pyridoxal phosphate-dependent enzyme [Rhodoferax sp.]MCL4740122.1 aminotransferase class I/II-fold pyridoxal phosphate-dependent enzyme [Burkholderiaceae bacterium]MCP5288582.1 aminotransferase class I/II-fold pyridoxal phosphate-dependent enzyme [Burkholderiaceae bacterium]